MEGISSNGWQLREEREGGGDVEGLIQISEGTFGLGGEEREGGGDVEGLIQINEGTFGVGGEETAEGRRSRPRWETLRERRREGGGRFCSLLHWRAISYSLRSEESRATRAWQQH